MSDLSRLVLAALRDRCATCGGSGEIEESRDARPTEDNGGLSHETRWIRCPVCQPEPQPVTPIAVEGEEPF